AIVDAVVWMDAKGELHQEALPRSGKVTLPEQGLAWLSGRVQWVDPEAPDLDAPQEVIVRVNGIRHFPTLLSPRQGKGVVRTFRVPLLLTGADNPVSLEVPGLKEQTSGTPDLTVRCSKPGRTPWHVLLVGADENRDEADFKAQVFKRLGIERAP